VIIIINKVIANTIILLTKIMGTGFNRDGDQMVIDNSVHFEFLPFDLKFQMAKLSSIQIFLISYSFLQLHFPYFFEEKESLFNSLD
jgi:hypothetical protein